MENQTVVRQEAPFEVISEFTPSGDQPTAIKELAERINAGEKDIVLLGDGYRVRNGSVAD